FLPKSLGDSSEQSINTRLDPWVFMFSAGYRF
ncbi:outer membrane protein OmpW, partial [Enterobacter hormaechei]